VLPILYGDRFVARFEPGRDKKGEALTIQNWWWEPDARPTEELKAALRDCLARFLRFLGRESVRIEGEVAERADIGWLASVEAQETRGSHPRRVLPRALADTDDR
jgi:uncharacterized protein YcaQ